MAKPGETEDESEEDRERLESRWGKKGVNPTDYRIVRDGDHLMNPYECDLCIFHKLTGRDPSETSEMDSVMMEYIRQMNLDVLWSRATQTIQGN